MIYEPAEDSFLLASVLKKYVKNKSVLDLGTGSGILALTALKNGAHSVLAVDSNPEVQRLLKNEAIRVRTSNLFSKIKEKFDVIICNPPYLPRDVREDKESARITTGGEKGDEFILKFLSKAPDHLEKNGLILLLFSSLTPLDRINSLIKKQSLICKVVKKKSLFMEKLFVWEIRKAKL